jgi:hypothetical protein
VLTSPENPIFLRKREKEENTTLVCGICLSKKGHDFDCMKCGYINCLNLFKKSEDSVDAGQELYVYSILGEKIEEKIDFLSAYVCVNGKFLNASCFLTGPIYTQRKKSYLKEILVQATRDFKASIFLAFSGHYRQAMQVLRCAFENIISGIYFQSDFINLLNKEAKAEDFAVLDRRFNEWKRQGRGDIRRSIEVLRRINFLSIDEERDYYQLYDLLSRFIHTPKEFDTYVKHTTGQIKLKREIICPASTYFDEEHLIEWSNSFQSVFVVLLKTIATFHPEAFRTEPGEIAMKIIKGMMKDFADKMKVSGKIQEVLQTVQR